MILHLRIVSGPVLPPEPLPTHGPLATTSATRVTEGFSAPVAFALPTSEPVSTRPPPPQAIPQLPPQSAPALQPASGPQAGPAPSPSRPATQALFGFPVPPCKSDLCYIYTLHISKGTKYWMYFDRTTGKHYKYASRHHVPWLSHIMPTFPRDQQISQADWF